MGSPCLLYRPEQRIGETMSGIIGISPDMKSGVVGKYPVGHIVQSAGGQASAGSGVTSSSWQVNAPAFLSLYTHLTLPTKRIV